jgi:hypothetical protein
MAKNNQKTAANRRKMVVARIDAQDFAKLSAIAKANCRSVGAEIKHKLRQMLAA